MEAGTVWTDGEYRNSTGLHLHFSIQKDEVAVDPLHYLPPR
jgi:murein DD-endopeptidase MepM/ murein hydrolase activator NlpD